MFGGAGTMHMFATRLVSPQPRLNPYNAATHPFACTAFGSSRAQDAAAKDVKGAKLPNREGDFSTIVTTLHERRTGRGMLVVENSESNYNPEGMTGKHAVGRKFCTGMSV